MPKRTNPIVDALTADRRAGLQSVNHDAAKRSLTTLRAQIRVLGELIETNRSVAGPPRGTVKLAREMAATVKELRGNVALWGRLTKGRP